MNTTADIRAQINWVTQNHTLVPYEDAKISVMAPGLTFAALVFEGFRAYWNSEVGDLFIFRLEYHLLVRPKRPKQLNSCHKLEIEA